MEETQRKIKGVDGVDRVYTFAPINVEQALDIEDTILRAGAKAVRNLGEIGVELDNLFSGDVTKLMGLPDCVFSAIPRETIKEVATVILRGAVISNAQDTIRIDNLMECPYFRGRWMELVAATVAGIDVSFPGYFSRARAWFKDFVAPSLGLTLLPAKNGASATK